MSNPEDNQPQYKVGDVVNGHVLTPANTWEPVGAPQAPPVAPPVTPPASGKPKRKWYLRKRVLIPVGVLVLIIMVSAINGGSKTDNVADTKAPAAAAEAPASEEEPAEVPEVEKITVPDVTGLSAAAALETLRAAGFEVEDVADPDNATVMATVPAPGGIAEKGSTVTVTVQVVPKLSLAQQNAVGQAESYLSFTAFSRSGLIEQLEYEGYSAEEATFAVDQVAPDWNAQAAAQAKSYLEMSSFSREGLYDQLIYEGFSDAEANAGLAAVGY